MSALAARRAAAATASKQPSNSVSSSFVKKDYPAKSVPVSRNRDPSPTPSLSISEGSDADVTFQQQSRRQSKRRKVEKEGVQAKTRYFAEEAKASEPTKVASTEKKRKQRARFSPSAPAANIEFSDEELGGDSSDDDEGLDQEEDQRHGMDQGVLQSAPSSVPVTPLGTPGPSRPRNRYNTTTNGDQHLSSFVPQEGVNIVKLSEESLRTAGIPGVGPGVIVILKPTDSLMIAGAFQVLPLQCALTIFSTTLYPEPTGLKLHRVFAPTTHPLPNLHSTTSGVSSIVPNALQHLSIESLSRLRISEDSCVFLIRESHSGIEGMTAGAIPGFGNVWATQKSVWDLQGVHPVLGSFPIPVYPHVTPESWTTAFNSLCPKQINSTVKNDDEDFDDTYDLEEAESTPIVALIKGPKRSGKSTFARSAANKLLERYERVAWLECDLGQGEFSPGGIIGLWIIEAPILGAPFTHLTNPVRAHFLGADTPMAYPDEYLVAIQHILEYYRYEVQYPLERKSQATDRRNDVVPLVINTQGWVKGLGEELLRSIEAMAGASHTFEFPVIQEDLPQRPGWTNSPPMEYSTLPGITDATSRVVLELEPAPIYPLQARYTSADFRTLSLLSYFYSKLPSDCNSRGLNWDFSTPLAAQSPWEITLGEAIKEVYMIGEGSENIIPEDLSLALNGSIVALCQRLAPPSFHQGSDLEVYIQNRPLPSMDEINFLGYAFIRAVSPGNSPLKLHILTPLSPEVLEKASIMIRNGALEMPNPGMIDWRSTISDAERPFFDSASAGVGGERRRIRRNVMRKGM